MQQTDPIPATDQPASSKPNLRRRLVWILLAILAVLIILVVPPLINVSHFQRRIASSISGSLGRPVHLDRVSLTLLPTPGFTLENLVVSEDPAFGYEPIIRANQVHATLRISSLWRRRVEFSTISFTEPSVNLVHTPEGKWNLESILLQASRVSAAPTAQTRAGAAPRFPYIEATGGRLNLKNGVEKTPFSLTDADFALWLPEPNQWHVRLQGRPVRTDTSVTDTGAIRIEATLGRAPSIEQVPIDLNGDWRGAPLGEATRVLLGRDAGWRGDIDLSTRIHGTLGQNTVTARLRIDNARRADFVPDHPLAIDIECRGQSSHVLHAFDPVHCSSTGENTFALSGAMPDVRDWRRARFEAGIADLPAQTLIGWWHVFSSRVPEGLTASGTLNGSVSYDALSNSSASIPPGASTSFNSSPLWSGELILSSATLLTPATADTSLLTGDVALRSAEHGPPNAPTSAGTHALRVLATQPYGQPNPLFPRGTANPRNIGTSGTAASTRGPAASTTGNTFLLAPVSLNLGGDTPATLEGRIDGNGYTLYLTGAATTARLLTLAHTLPQLGDGLPEAIGASTPDASTTHPNDTPHHIDLTATRPWGGTQTWHQTSTPTPPRHHR